MKVLFVCSVNRSGKVSPILLNQAYSLTEQGVEVDYYTIDQPGLVGYFKHIFLLKRFLKTHSYDAIHAHYSYSGIAASLANAKPLLISLMGSDTNVKSISTIVLNLFVRYVWQNIIVKSPEMKLKLNTEKVKILPNGVNLNVFKPIERSIALAQSDWDSSKRHVLFPASKLRPEKNFKLALEAFNLFTKNQISEWEIHTLENTPSDLMPFIINSSDIVLLTSIYEGSPNVIKESMACNKPIVSTDIGDVKLLFTNSNCCFITSFNVNDVVNKLNEASQITNSCNSRESIKHLDSRLIAEKIVSIYEKMK